MLILDEIFLIPSPTSPGPPFLKKRIHTQEAAQALVQTYSDV